MLLTGYAQGIFPMAHAEHNWEVYWYAPDPRTILPLDTFHVSKSLARTVRKGIYEIRYDTAFREVMLACAEPRGDGQGTWISDELIDGYLELHEMGFAHSVEAWLDGELVGGLYGIALRGMFAGESMFHRATDASKVCLVHLVEHLKAKGFVLHDCQFMTPHLSKFGAQEITRYEYEERLRDALLVDAHF